MSAGMTREERAALITESLRNYETCIEASREGWSSLISAGLLFDAVRKLAAAADALEDEVQAHEMRAGETPPASGQVVAGASDAGTVEGILRAFDALDPMWLSEDAGDLDEAEDAMSGSSVDYLAGRTDHPLPADVLRVLEAVAAFAVDHGAAKTGGAK